MSEDRRSYELLNLLGEADFVRLAEIYGGTRLYVPASGDASQIARKLSQTAADKLAQRYSGTHIRVPLARDIRARQYRAFGLSNADIARRLLMTETGVDKIFRRMVGKPLKGSRDPRQADLFTSN